MNTNPDFHELEEADTHAAILSAYNKLSDVDKYFIDDMVQVLISKVKSCKSKAGNAPQFSKIMALEVLAKLGIWKLG